LILSESQTPHTRHVDTNFQVDGPRFSVVGIGASAGGLETLQEFFQHASVGAAVAYVVVTHQLPGSTSLMPELLGKYTEMDVVEATDGTCLEPNHVYVGPPDVHLALHGGSLYLMETENAESARFPIDYFFRSLAHDQKENAIGIVLSGTGTDGTLGLKAIKSESGVVLVQQPQTAKYAGMPSSAIATGLVDYVLPPSDLFAQIPIPDQASGVRAIPNQTLRTRAEKLLRTSQADVHEMPPEDLQALVNDLQVHQIELQLQNEELRNAQHDLAISRDRYSELYESAPVGYLTIDINGKIRHANLKAAAILGVDRPRLINRTFSGFVDRNSRNDWHLHCQNVFLDESPTCELTIVRPDSTPCVVRLESFAVAAPQDHPTIRRFAMIDITQLKEAEEWAVQAKRLRKMVENLPAGAVFVEHDRVKMNRAAETITGYSRDEIRTLDQWYRKLFGYKAAEMREFLLKERHGGFRKRITIKILRKDCCLRIVEFAGHGFDDHQVWLIHDVTERDEAESALCKSEHRFEMLANNVPELFSYIDSNQCFQFANRSYQELHQQPGSEFIGKHVREILGEQTYQTSVREPLENALAGQRILDEFEMQLGDLGRRWCQTSYIPDVVSGRVTGVYFLITDLTDRRSLERQVLHIASEENRRIAQDLHDGIGQELTGMGMIADALFTALSRRDAPESKIARKLQISSQRTLQQVRTLASGMNPVDIDGRGLVVAISKMCDRVRELYNIECQLKIPHPIEFRSNQTATQLFRISQEATTNAIKHGNATCVTISLVSGGKLPFLQVIDNGIGIEPGVPQSEGMGLRTMRYRAGVIGGRLSINRLTGGGTSVVCTFAEEDISRPAKD
jgi:PAS domain S-box-containing protein